MPGTSTTAHSLLQSWMEKRPRRHPQIIENVWLLKKAEWYFAQTGFWLENKTRLSFVKKACGFIYNNKGDCVKKLKLLQVIVKAAFTILKQPQKNYCPNSQYRECLVTLNSPRQDKWNIAIFCWKNSFLSLATWAKEVFHLQGKAF